MTAPQGSTLGGDLVAIGAAAGLAAVGIAGAEPFQDTRQHLESRRKAGLHGRMQFTFRNPQRSTDPGQTLVGARSLVVGAWGYRRRDDEEPGDAVVDDEPQPGRPTEATDERRPRAPSP